MSTRISSARLALAVVLLLAACHRGGGDGGATANSDDAERIACAHGSAAMARDCTVDRLESGQGLVLTIRHPDGAFRRLLVTKDGRGVIAADGAQPAVVTIDGPDRITVAIGGDRYRLPATVKAATPTPKPDA